MAIPARSLQMRQQAPDVDVDITDAAAVTVANPAAITQAALGAQGTGGTAGGYDNSTNRNLFIASVTALRVDSIAVRAQAVAANVDIAALIASLNDMIKIAHAAGIAKEAAVPTGITGMALRENLQGNVPIVALVTATVPTLAATTQVAPPAGGTGATVGCFENATTRDAAITAVTAGGADLQAISTAIIAAVADLLEVRTMLAAMRTAMQQIGLAGGGTARPVSGFAIRCREDGTPVYVTAVASMTAATPGVLTQLDPPAGGTGADAGGYDLAANRNLCVVSIDAAGTDIAALRTWSLAAVVDMTEVRAQAVALNNALLSQGVTR